LKRTLAKLATRKRLRVAGLMSGTSADGVDAAVCDITSRGVRVVAFHTRPYPAAVRRRLLDLFAGKGPGVEDLCHLNAVLGELFAEALVRLCEARGIGLESVDLVGSHGQTVCHLPAGRRFRGRRVGSTLQIGEPSVIAERTGIATVADFRPRDVAAGGEGAPLVPYADWFLFRHATRTRTVQNIGGIANVTFLAAGGGVEDVVAFDTGPGNMVIDRLVSLATGGRRAFDASGRMAARGSVDGRLLSRLMRHPFVRRRPPKSTGREAFGAAFSDALWDRGRRAGLSAADVVATATAFTAESIAQAYRRHLPRLPDEVFLCGGGARNAALRESVAQALRPARVALTDELGIDADAKEAVSFAVLARETVRGVAANVPAATGAGRPVVLGKLVPGR